MSSKMWAAALLAAGISVTAVTGCSGTPGTSSASSVTCTSYPIQGTGAFHDEVQVQVNARNATSAAANYQADVVMTLAGGAAAGAPVHVTVSGLVPARSSGVLSRKVLAAAKAVNCKLSRLSPT
ncbi:MAG TPA: hypothetical protein VHZ03_34370 [Trebonia sp.]|jgi:hypothetical protein|nr:hypothetical protein [Trebonia sp.]